jgi:flavin-dependent dehydrogenase
MPKVHPEFEQGYREGHENGYNLGRRAVDFAKRDLAEKARKAISDLWIDTRFDSQWRNGFEQCKGEALRAVEQLFTESVAVKGEG